MGDTLFPDLVVNGEHIPHTAVAAEVQNHTAPKGKPGLAWRKAAKALAMRALLLQEARRRGLTPVPEVLSPGRIETGDEALIRQLLDEAVQVPAPSDTAVRDEWARDPERFRDLMRRTVEIHQRLQREWPRLAEEYRSALGDITSPEAWEETFRPWTEQADD